MTETPRGTFLPYLAIGICILALSTSAFFIRFADAPGPVTGFYRMLIATLLMTPLALYRLHKHKKLNRRNFLFPLAGGIFSGLDLGTWTIALGFTSVANATLLGNTAPLWVALGTTFFFHERLKQKFWIGLLLAMAGSALIVGTDYLLHPRLGVGDTIALFTGIFYAGYYLFTELGRRTLDALTHTWLVGISASFTLLILNLFLGNSLRGYSIQTWGIFFATAIISQLIGYLASSYALGHLPASVVSVTMIGQPVVTALFAIPLLGEIPERSQLLGGILALTGIYLVNVSHNRPKMAPGDDHP